MTVFDSDGLFETIDHTGRVTYSSAFGASCDAQCYVYNPVNTAIGNDTDISIDLAIPGPGDSAIIIDRNYNSQDERDGPFGRGSSFTYSMTLTVHDNPLLQGVQVHYGDGHTANFRQNGSVYDPVSPGNFDRVERSGSNFILRLKDRSSFVFDSNGRLIETRTRNGVPIRLSYNGAGKVATIADQTGRGITLHWNGDHIIQIDAPEGKTLYYTYDGAKLKTFTDGRDKTTHFQHDSADRITAVITPNGYPHLRQELDARGRVLWQIIGEHERGDFTYDDATRTTTVKDSDGETTYVYDSNYFIQQIIDKHGKSAGFVHDSRGNLRQQTDRNGNTWSYDYDANGNRILQIDPPAACASAPYTSDITRWRYDSFSQVISKTDSLGATWIYTYSAQGDLTAILEPNNALTELTYDNLGQIREIKDANQHPNGFTYDQYGNQEHVTDANTHVLSATFDLLGRVTSRSDANNHTTGFSYDGADNITQIRDPRDHTWDFGYDDNGNLTTLTNRRGVVHSFTYDKSDNLKEERAYPGAFPVSYGYDTRNRLTSITDQLGYTRTYTYDALDRLTAEADRASATFRYQYDWNGNRTLQIDPYGVRTTYQYDAVNRLILETDAIDSHVAYCYDSEDRLIRRDGPRSGETYRFSYDPLGRPTGVTDPQGNTWTNRYDPVGNLIAAIDPLDHQTDYTYDALNRLEAQLRPALPDGSRPTARYTYDPAGNLTRLASPRGFDSVFSYDENDNLVSFRDGAGATSSYTYDEEDNPLVSSDAKGNPTAISYGPNGLPQSVTDARGSITHLAYDPADNLIRVDDALGRPTRYAYDPEQRLIAATDPLVHQTVYRRDLLGRVTGVDDANGHRTSYSYDILGRLIRVTDGNSSPTHYAYDVADNLIGITDANGNTTTFRYSLLNQLLAEENPLGERWSYAYDPAGRMIRRVDALDRPTSYAFDSNDRLIGVQYGVPAGEQAPLIFQYDVDGNQTAACNDLGCVSTGYDAVGRATTTTDVFGRIVRRGYDAVGNPLAMIYPDGRQLRYAYDVTNQLINVTLPGERDSLFQRDALGRVTRAIHPNGLQSSYAYDEAGRLTSLDHRLAGAAAPISAYAYTLDAVGNRTAVQETRAAFDGSTRTTSLDHRYSYDKTDRLIESATAMSVGSTPTGDGTTNYRFDAAGNRLARDGSLLAPNPGLPALPVAARPEATNYRYNTANQIVQAGGTSLNYDGNGNRAHEQRRLADGRLETIDYRYDRENRLVGVTRAVNGATTMEAGYEYDAYGRRVRKTVRWLGKPAAVTTFLYDGLDIIGAKVESSGKTTEVYYYLAPSPLTGMRRPLAAQHLGSGATDWYLLDGLDSIAGMTDERGRLDAPALYDDYGRLLAGDPAAALFTYTGQDYDAETGLLHFYARYYDPERGVWLTQDSYRGRIGAPGTLHRYGYVGGRPVSYIDPWGYWSLGDVWNTATQTISAIVSFGINIFKPKDSSQPSLNKSNKPTTAPTSKPTQNISLTPNQKKFRDDQIISQLEIEIKSDKDNIAGRSDSNQCVWWVYQRRKSLGADPLQGLGEDTRAGKDTYGVYYSGVQLDENKSLLDKYYSDKIIKGTALVKDYSTGEGHIMIIERVEEGRVWVSESNVPYGSGPRVNPTPISAEDLKNYLIIAPHEQLKGVQENKPSE